MVGRIHLECDSIGVERGWNQRNVPMGGWDTGTRVELFSLGGVWSPTLSNTKGKTDLNEYIAKV